MNKIISVVVAVLMFGSAVTILLLNNKKDSEQTVNSANSDVKQTDLVVEADNNMGYVEYSQENLAKSEGTSRVVFFHANWCSTCNYFEGQIESDGVPEGVTILKVDYDKDTDVKKLYGVSVQSTFVLLDDNGDVKETWPFASGLRSIQDLYDSVI